ncbi:NrfG protein [Salmonella enterica subsp. salamae]|nr:NrfG protein [Salmonella enterica subsp. salamae serovar Sofia]EBS4543938.1 NrfG protein [Salmonella enterica subsp. salamae serovar Sofia]
MQVCKIAGVFILFCTVSLLSGGCSLYSQKKNNTPQQLELLKSSKNYGALIEIYREKLKSNENSENRYALSYYYYSSGDCLSALQYIAPISEGNMRNRVLFIRSLVACEKYNDAIIQANSSLRLNPNNYDLLNLRGVAEALSGKTQAGRKSIQMARDLFIRDKTAINNLAMIEIIEGHYDKAVKILLPLYQNGCKDLTIVHNLVYSLVKSGYMVYAQNIIEKEKLSDDADSLIKSLKLSGSKNHA